MPLFYFHFRGAGQTWERDATGLDLPNTLSARLEAQQTVAGLLTDARRRGDDLGHLILRVEDDHGLEVFEIAVSGSAPSSGSECRRAHELLFRAQQNADRARQLCTEISGEIVRAHTNLAELRSIAREA